MNSSRLEDFRSLSERIVKGVKKTTKKHPKLATSIAAAAGLAVPLTILSIITDEPRNLIAMPSSVSGNAQDSTASPTSEKPLEMATMPTNTELVAMSNKVLTTEYVNGRTTSFIRLMSPEFHVENLREIPTLFTAKAGPDGLQMRRAPTTSDLYLWPGRIVYPKQAITLGARTQVTSNTLANGDGSIQMFGMDAHPFVTSLPQGVLADAPNIYYSKDGQVFALEVIYYRIGEKPLHKPWKWYINPHPTVEENGFIDWSKPVYELPQATLEAKAPNGK